MNCQGPSESLSKKNMRVLGRLEALDWPQVWGCESRMMCECPVMDGKSVQGVFPVFPPVFAGDGLHKMTMKKKK